MTTEKKKGSSVERVLHIIELVANSQIPLSIADLAQALDIPLSSAHRLVGQLESTGFLQFDIQGRIICGQRTHSFAMNLWQTGHYKAERLSVLQKLSDQIDETVGIAIMQDLEVVYVDRVLSNWPLQIYLPAGTHVPIWASASGKLLLAQLPDNECHRIINRMTIHALTKSTLVDKHILLDKIDSIRHSQVGTDNEEFIPGMVACAVPIPNGDNPVFATVFTHGHTIRKSLDELLSYVPQMQEAALALQQIFQRQSM